MEGGNSSSTSSSEREREREGNFSAYSHESVARVGEREFFFITERKKET